MKTPKEVFLENLMEIVTDFEIETGAEIIWIDFQRAGVTRISENDVSSAIQRIELDMR